MCLCALKELTANYTEREREWDLVPWNQTRDVCTQWPMLPATEVSDVPASAAGTNGVFYAQALQWERCVLSNSFPGGWCEWRKYDALHGNWNRDAGHSSCCGCWLLGQLSVSVFPKTVMHGVCICIRLENLSWTRKWVAESWGSGQDMKWYV